MEKGLVLGLDDHYDSMHKKEESGLWFGIKNTQKK